MRTEERAAGNFLDRHFLLCSLVLLLITRLVACFNTAIISRDSVVYIQLARYWVAGHYFKALAHPCHYHPLYPFLIAVAVKVFGFSFEHSAVGLSIIASALTLPALAIVYQRFENRLVLVLGMLFFLCFALFDPVLCRCLD